MLDLIKAAIASTLLLHAPLHPSVAPATHEGGQSIAQGQAVYQANPRDKFHNETFDLKAFGLAGVVTVSRPVVPIKTLTPGTTLPADWAAWSDPAQIGSGAFATQLPMLRPTDVPNQTINGDYYLSFLAFHSNGMRDLTYSVNNGPMKTVTAAAANPHTRNATTVGRANGIGVVSFAIRIDASLFNYDGLAEVRVRANPNAGLPRDMSFQFNVNAGGLLTRSSLIRYVSNSGNNATGDGSFANPYHNIIFAVWDLCGHASDHLTTSPNQGTLDGATIYLMPGSYTVGGMNSNDIFISDTVPQWVKIAPAPGHTVDEVTLDAADASGGFNRTLRIPLLHVQNITLTSIFFGDGIITQSIWYDGCKFTGPGRYVDVETDPGNAGTYSVDYTYAARYMTECDYKDAGNFINNVTLARNTKVHTIAQSGFRGCFLVANCEISDIDRGIYVNGYDGDQTHGLHPDAYQCASGEAINWICYELKCDDTIKATCIRLQNVTADLLSADGVAIINSQFTTDAAYVAEGGYLWELDVEMYRNMFVSECTFGSGGHNFTATTGTFTDCVFSGNDHSPTPTTGLVVR